MPSKERAIKTFTQISSFIVLLAVSSAFGFMAMPTEMGLAIMAGALGLGFANIEKISKFKGAGFEAEMKMVQTIIESQTEPSSEQQERATKFDGISVVENRILKSLQKPGYTWRYAKTIAKETTLAIADIESALSSLMARGLAKSSSGANGEIWAATALGKSVQEQYEAKKA
ncbi:hypothetical protein DLREEDagrD3_12950 [Denitratisoma sp. agr-D3]